MELLRWIMEEEEEAVRCRVGEVGDVDAIVCCLLLSLLLLSIRYGR